VKKFWGGVLDEDYRYRAIASYKKEPGGPCIVCPIVFGFFNVIGLMRIR
jgi:hypothetical protein